jgi:hypothetical protein
MKMYHPDVFDHGLKLLADNAASIKMAVCTGIPATRAEAAGLHPAGKRASEEIEFEAGQLPLSNDGTGRKITVPQKGGEAAVTLPAGVLTIALYDATRLLVLTDETSDQALTVGNPLTVPSWTAALHQPPEE